MPIPICWIKRFWYWTLHKTKLFNWEEEIRKFQKDQRDTIRKDQWDTIIRILENLDRISIRAKVKGEWWDSFTLKELIMVGEEKQVINWIKDLFNL